MSALEHIDELDRKDYAYSILLSIAPKLEEWRETKSIRLAADICEYLCGRMEIKNETQK